MSRPALVPSSRLLGQITRRWCNRAGAEGCGVEARTRVDVSEPQRVLSIRLTRV